MPPSSAKPPTPMNAMSARTLSIPVAVPVPKMFASSPTLTDPAARKRCTISLWRRTASGRVMRPREWLWQCGGKPGGMTSPLTIALYSETLLPRVPFGQCAVILEHGLQQYLCASRTLFLGSEFRLIVADAIAARNENHRGGGDARNIGCVMPGAGNNLLRRKSAALGGAAYRLNARGIE